MSTEPSPRAEQIQANVAAALSRLRGEPAAQAAPSAPAPRAEADHILTEGEPLFSVDANASATMGVPDPSMALGPHGSGTEPAGHRDTPFERLTGLTPDDQPDLLQGIGASPPPFADLPDAEVEAARRKRRLRNRLLLGAAAVALLAGFWILSGGDSGTQEVPVITADGSPERVKPEEEGGLAVPNQDVAILNNADGTTTNQAETVLPAPEQPAAPPPPPAVAATEVPATDVPATVATAPEAATATPGIPSVSAPDVTAIPSVPAPTELGAADPAAATPETAAPAAETAATEAAPAETAPAETAAATDLPKVSAAIQPVPGGTARIQLASVKSEDGARAEWARLQKAHPAILGGLELHIERFEKSAGDVYYRVQAGPLGDKASAKQICADLKQKNQACIVAN
ncbi:SPOR domain-containing protein [Dongia sp.]|uniref:SPOR domain-containing protein n=1 Tax=Dongia sp. TaxID=1977262 RepID=UPI0035AE9EB5